MIVDPPKTTTCASYVPYPAEERICQHRKGEKVGPCHLFFGARYNAATGWHGPWPVAFVVHPKV